MAGGLTAMQDTMGQASALTGGYGNSYAQTVGQQQYQGYLQQLNDKIPELYQLARDSYDRDLSNLYNRYGLLSDAEAKEYSRYRDEVSDYYADRDYLTNRFYNERDFDYGQWSDNRNFSYQQHRDNIADEQWKKAFDREVYESDRDYNRGVYESDRNYNYQVGRDSVADQQWQQQFDRGVFESDRDYNYNIGRDAVEDKRYDAQWQNTLAQQAIANSQWQKEYDLAVKKAYADIAKTNAEAYAKQQEALALYGGEDDDSGNVTADGDKVKGWYDYSDKEHNQRLDENGGSIYQSTLADLKGMKKSGVSDSEVQKYLLELVGNSHLTREEYMSLYNKYRDNRLN
jgi:hypothetical protein